MLAARGTGGTETLAGEGIVVGAGVTMIGATEAEGFTGGGSVGVDAIFWTGGGFGCVEAGAGFTVLAVDEAGAEALEPAGALPEAGVVATSVFFFLCNDL